MTTVPDDVMARVPLDPDSAPDWDHLRYCAEWLDIFDRAFPNAFPSPGHDMQDNLRRIADDLEKQGLPRLRLTPLNPLDTKATANVTRITVS